ncbi:hypothetical protein NWP17_01420 [Chrysosporum bergii ANA360D]|jgi:hypothetical protein|uniref:Uncharacterized protein n=1 Tax=Chrysosporum bergii ANA360D TaxID=617107 RepID=A0AA43KAV0_9CYAN|nr:hypothetical protein [Chrysosporum bergii]MDH6059115.1 hypothetical protein [Chrysosporum bergii ANA360D]
MANITLSQLHAAGSELFQDSESFLNELSDVDSISGGQVVGTAVAGVSNPITLTKLAEAFVYTYGIEHVTLLAKSFSLVL